MKRKKELIVVLTSLLVIVLSVSVAYFTTKILGTGKEISVESADLKVIFTSGSGTINGTNIEPGWTSGENTFTVKNESNGTYKYNIIIKDLVNTFVTTGFLQYKITSADGGYNMTDFTDVPKSSSAKDTVLAFNINIDKGATHTYTIEIKYLESTDVDQSADMGKMLSGKIFIEDKFKGGTLSEAIMYYNPTIGTRTDFSTPFTTNTANTLYKATENGTDVYYFAGEDRRMVGRCTYKGADVFYNGEKLPETESECLLSTVTVMADDDTKVSLVADDELKSQLEEVCKQDGITCTNTNDYATWNEDETISTVNNWVKFGKYQSSNIKYRGYYSETDTNYREYSTMEECTSSDYNYNCAAHKYASAGDDMYWRIIRTNADGSVRLLYSGTSPDTTESLIGTSAFNTNDNPKYVGYMYGDTESTLDEARTNTNDSTIKAYIDNWYANNMTSYTKYLSTTAVYCNDRKLASGASYSTTGKFHFKAYDRLEANKTPTYDCTNIKDAFSVNNTEAKLKYPIALTTADEISYAGGVYSENANEISKIWIDINSHYNYYNDISKNEFWWVNTPYYHDSVDGTGVYITSNGILSSVYVFLPFGVRPVTSLKSCVTWKSGNGSADNPYEIALNGGC